MSTPIVMTRSATGLDSLLRARGVCLAGILLVACSQPHPTAAVSPPTSAVPSAQPASAVPSAQPASAVPSAQPTVAGDLLVAKVDFSCQLPVITVKPGIGGPVMQGGFVTFPSGQLADDPSGTMLPREDPHTDYATTASPVLYGEGGGFYDLAAKRWVPASPAATLADGSAYAYVTTDSMAQIVDIASGSIRTFDLRSLDRPDVLDFDSRGVYLYSPSAIGGPGEGVRLLNRTTGSVTRVRTVHRVWAVRYGKAWVARFDPRDKTVWPGMEIQPANSLAQVDLATGAETEWFYRAGAYPWMIGFASGQPLISVSGRNGQSEVRLIDRPGSGGKLVYSGSLEFDGYFENYQGDGDRIWLGSERGIYLYRPDRGFQKVFAYGAAPGSGGDIHPAGFCR